MMWQATEWQRLAQTAVPGCELLAIRPLAGGSSAQMTALDIRTATGAAQTLVARQRAAGEPGAEATLAREYGLLETLAALNLPAPRPLRLDEEAAVLLLDYVPGEMAFAPPDVLAAARQMAQVLAAIHNVPTAVPTIAGLPQRGPDCAEAVRQPAHDALPSGLLRIALLAAGPPKSANAPVLLHGDFWPGNVVWQDGRLAAVIDWEDARRGDPLIDLGISRLDLTTIWGSEAMETFTTAYVAVRAVDLAGLPYWDLCAAIRLARLVGEDLSSWAAYFGRPTISAASIRDAYEMFTAAALGALRT